MKILEEDRNGSLKDSYQTYAIKCEAALKIIEAQVNNIKASFVCVGERSPLLDVKYRTKTLSSAIEKATRKKVSLDLLSIKERIRDIAGARIITLFEDDIYNVERCILKIPGVTLYDRKDFVETPKRNGYRSLHLHVKVEISNPISGSESIPVEIQIRSEAMHLWASLEHIVKYKNPNPLPEAEEKLLGVAKSLMNYDKMAMELRNASLLSEAEIRSALDGHKGGLNEKVYAALD
ncbi:hypothetical protein IJI29_03620 [Candidatus Saccharibacteria bacterium]|nr:hypothetical protein [Candidatus Saccharibacteria bacterium]